MAQASRSDQLTLLSVAEFDSQIARLERDNVKHPLREKLGAVMNGIAARARDKEAAEAATQAAQDSLAAAEKKCAQLQAQISDKEAKLNSGAGLTSRDLLVLQDEISGLRDMLSAASDEEFAALEAVEAADTRVAQIGALIDQMKDQMVADRAELEDAISVIQAEQESLRARRTALYDPLGDDLKKVYEHSRKSGGYAVMGMHANGTTGAGVQLSPVEVAQIRALPEDEIYLSDDYDAIVVRLD